MRLSAELRACVVTFLAIVATVTPAQSVDDSQSKPPVAKSDVEIVKRARQILNSPEKWNRADNRNCPRTEVTFSLYCALEEATYEVTQSFAHRGAAMQESRFVIDEDLAANNRYDHRLMDYNNDPHTTFADVQRFFDLLQGRIEGRLAEQEEIVHLITAKPETPTPLAKVNQTDIEIVKKVQTLLDSRAKWDKTSSQDCKPDAKTFGLYCAFEAASVAVTGKSGYAGPAIEETRQLISMTAPNSPHYSARLVDYNNDPTVTLEELQALLKTVQINLERTMANQRK